MGTPAGQELNREELAWVAGFYEGEGSIHYNAGSYGIQLSVRQKDYEPLYHMKRALGFGRIDGPYSSNPCAGWRVTNFEQVQATVALMWPWLSERRREQACKALIPAREGRVRRRRT